MGVQSPTIYDGERTIKASNINPYLVDALNLVIESRPKPICDVPAISYGNKPSDGGNLILSQEEKDLLDYLDYLDSKNIKFILFYQMQEKVKRTFK